MQAWDVDVDSCGRLCVSSGGYVVRKAQLASSYRRRLRHLGPLPDRVRDLFDVAAVIHAADRLIPRASEDSDKWSRHIRIRSSVRDHRLWSHPQIKDAMLDSLGYLTEDTWELDFVAGHREGVTGQHVLPIEHPTRIGLFSGGLDSLIGIALEAEMGSFGTLLPLAIWTSSRLMDRQKRLLKLVWRPTILFSPVIVSFRLRQREPHREAEERTQRTRGFLFTSFAAAVAEVCKADEILIFENGIGAINLPLTPAQIGAQSTRSTHPVAVQKLERFLGLLLDKALRLRLPFLFRTKGESCRALAETSYRDFTGLSVSCDRFPLRVAGKAQCGVCTSCLLRRQALWEAGLEDVPEGGYRYDILKYPARIPEEEFLPLKEMEWQIHRVRTALDREDPWRGLLSEFPAVREVAEIVAGAGIPVEKAQRELTQLYRRYSSEWARFPLPFARLARAA